MAGNITSVIKLLFFSNNKKYVGGQNSFCLELFIW